MTLPAVPKPIAAVAMSCADNGVDVNKATVSQLLTLPGVSRPIADRIVANRPFLRTHRDLLRVEGIGAGKMAAIDADGRACATPPTVPPPTFDVCTSGDGKLDVNRPESRTTLESVFGGPTTDRIVAGIPYWSLNQVRSEGEAGAGGGKMTKNLGKLCLTPPTIDFAGTRYGWIDGARGGLVDVASGGGRPSYRLTVPGGAVTSVPGAWGSITPTTANDIAPGVPAADFHIHGAHAGAVYVGLPPDTVGAEAPGEWTSTVWHQPAGAERELSWGDAVDHVDGRVTTATTSLSVFASVRQRAAQFGPWLGSTTVTVGTWAERTIRQFLQTGAAPPTCSPNTREGPQSDGAQLETFGYLLQRIGSFTPAIWHCIERHDRHSARWRFSLNRSASLVVRDDGLRESRAIDVGLTGDLLVDALIVPYANLQVGSGRPFILPGTSSLDVFRDSAREEGTLRVNGAGSTVAATLFVQALREAGLSLPSGVRALYSVLNDCVDSALVRALGYASGPATYDAVVGSVTSALQCVARTGSSRELRALLLKHGLVEAHEIASKVAHAVTIIKYVSYGSLAVDIAAIALVGDDQNDISMTFTPPAAPPPLPEGQPSGGGLPDGGHSLPPMVLLKRSGSSAAYYLDPERQAHHVPDGGTYICLTQYMPTWFGVDDTEFASVVKGTGGDAQCGVAAPRGLSPDPPYSVNDVFMRQIGGGGDTWFYIRPDGRKIIVLDGQPDCRFDNKLVWDYVSDTELGRFDSTPREVARTFCT